MCWCRPEVKTPNCGSVACTAAAAAFERGAASMQKELELLRNVARCARAWVELGGDVYRKKLEKALDSLPRCTKPPAGWTCTREAGHEGLRGVAEGSLAR